MILIFDLDHSKSDLTQLCYIGTAFSAWLLWMKTEFLHAGDEKTLELQISSQRRQICGVGKHMNRAGHLGHCAMCQAKLAYENNDKIGSIMTKWPALQIN